MKTIAAVTKKMAPVETVTDIVNTRTCLAFSPREKVSDIVRAMHGHHSGAAGVCDADGIFVGLITEREILRRLFGMRPETKEQVRFAQEEKPVMDLTAWDIMIAGPDCILEDRAINEALDDITLRGFRYMPVVSKHDRKKLLGIVGERELLMHVQEKARRDIQNRDVLLSYFLHHEPYGMGANIA